MSKAYICAVSSSLPENYELGVRSGTWGVERRHRSRIQRVRPGDRIVFIVGGEFRSIHPVTRGPYEDHTRIWPPRDGDVFPHRIGIGHAEVHGRVPVRDLAPSIGFMAGKQWGGTIRGPNGVFNDRLTTADLTLIASALVRSGVADEQGRTVPATRRIVTLEGTRWLPALLDRLAALSDLAPAARFTDPLVDAQSWREGLVTGVYADAQKVPTLGVLPVDREPAETVLSTLYGLSALKQSSERPPHVRGVIFVPEAEVGFAPLLHGVANLATVPFELRVTLRN